MWPYRDLVDRAGVKRGQLAGNRRFRVFTNAATRLRLPQRGGTTAKRRTPARGTRQVIDCCFAVRTE